jgi:hypothetical protein
LLGRTEGEGERGRPRSSGDFRILKTQYRDKSRSKSKYSIVCGSVLVIGAVIPGIASQFVNPVSGWDAVLIFIAGVLGTFGIVILIWGLSTPDAI